VTPAKYGKNEENLQKSSKYTSIFTQFGPNVVNMMAFNVIG